MIGTIMAGFTLQATKPLRAEDVASVAQAGETREYSIPAQPLASALNAYAAQSGISFAYRTGDLSGIRSPGVSGTHTTEDGLLRLLAGTGIIHEFTGVSTVRLSNVSAENLDSTVLDPIMVEARQSSTGDASYPGAPDGGNTVSITAEDLQRIDPQDLQDIFRDTPGVQVGSSLPISQKVYVNGIEETNLAVTIDGSRQKGKLFHHSGNVPIDPDLLKAVRVDPGVAPADAGPGALAGSIAYETKDVGELLAPGDNFGGSASTEYNTNGDIFTVDTTLFGRNSGFEALGYFKTARGSEFEDGDGTTVIGSETDLVSGLGKIGYQHDSGYRVELSYETVEDDGDRPYRANFLSTTGGRPVSATRTYRTKRENAVVSFENATPDGWVNPYARLALSTTHLDTLETDNNNFGTYESFNGAFGNTSKIKLGTINFGLDFYSDSAEGDFPDYGSEWIGLTERSKNVGVFGQARLEPMERLRLSFGARGDYNNFEGLDGSESDNSGLSGNVSGEFDVLPFLTASAGASHVFGGVELAEPFLANPDWVYPDGGMEPSTANNLFAGLEFHGDGLNPELAGVTVFGKVFKTTIDDIRDENYSGGPDVYSDVESVGFEVGAGYAWQDGLVRVSYADIDTEINGVSGSSEYQYIGTPIGQVITALAEYSFPSTGVTLGADAQFFLEEDSTNIYSSAATRPYPAYEVANAFVSYTPPDLDFLTVRATVKNIFDETYADRASAGQEYTGVEVLNEPGRSFILSAKMRF